MPRMITLNCPSCGAKARLSEDSKRVHCDHCGSEHLLQVSFQPVAAEPQKVIRPLMGMPGNIKIEQDETSWRIVKRWFSWQAAPLMLFSIVWIGFLVNWYNLAFQSREPLMLLFPAAHVAAGFYLAYYTLTTFVNRTTLEIYRGRLIVRHDPLPWPGEKSIPVSEIKQLYCKETLRRGKQSARLVYHLYAIKHDNVQVKLLGSLRSPEVALYLEQQLETWMRITDQPVLGEMAR